MKPQQPGGLQKLDNKELQKIWELLQIRILSELQYIEHGDIFKKVRYNGKTYKIEIKEVKK